MQTEKIANFFNRTERYLDNNFGVRLRQEIVWDLLGPCRNVRLLDIGCGNGAISKPFAIKANQLVLIDLSEKMLDLARANLSAMEAGEIRFEHGDYLSFVSSEKFDLILCIGVLAHVQSIDALIKKILADLQPGGSVVIQFSDQESIVGWFYNRLTKITGGFEKTYSYALNETNYKDILCILQQNGLVPIAHQRYSILIPGMGKLPDKWLYRWQHFTLRNRFLSRLGSEVILHAKSG